jgi:iron only hydrogenase large subunit-like protein
MGQLVSGILALGFDGVVEAAFGADVCLEHELAEWQHKKLLTTSCCPAFVSFIEKHFPDIVPYVSSSFSPMVETAKTIKKGDPTAKCIFIGPCAAKKMEVKNPKTEGYVDSAISFEELQAFFAARNVEVGDLAETEVNNATYFGRIFAKSGGITQGLVSLATEKGVEGLAPISMNGLAECKVNLLKLRAKLKSNKLVENFFEGMACEGGCINGPLTLHQSSKNATAVESHAKQATTQSVGEAVRQYDAGKMDFQK